MSTGRVRRAVSHRSSDLAEVICITVGANENLGSVGALWRYPVKSMMGEELNASAVGKRGLVGDRVYAIVDPETRKVASAKHPKKWPHQFHCRAASSSHLGRAGISHQCGSPFRMAALREAMTPISIRPSPPCWGGRANCKWGACDVSVGPARVAALLPQGRRAGLAGARAGARTGSLPRFGGCRVSCEERRWARARSVASRWSGGRRTNRAWEGRRSGRRAPFPNYRVSVPVSGTQAQQFGSGTSATASWPPKSTPFPSAVFRRTA
jgi:hypothetical protein